MGLKSHPHFRFLTALWHELGLQLIHLEILHSCHVIAIDRRRLLCILKRRDLCIPLNVIQHAAALVMPLPNIPATISSLGCLLPPNFHCTTLEFSVKELMRLSDPALSPGIVGTADETLKYEPSWHLIGAASVLITNSFVRRNCWPTSSPQMTITGSCTPSKSPQFWATPHTSQEGP